MNLSGNITIELPYDQKEKDFKNLIAKISSVKSNTIYIIGYANQTALITREIKTIGIKAQIVSTVATEDQSFINLAGKAANGVLYVFNSTIDNPVYASFKKYYKTKYQEEPKILTDVSFDATNIILNLLKENKIESGEFLINKLREMPEFEGASGNIKFDKNGDVHKSMILKVIENGRFLQYSK